MIKFKNYLALLLVILSTFNYAQTPTLIASGSYKASGSGSSGIPTVNINIPAGKNRVMIVTTYIERVHGTSYASNYTVSPDGWMQDNTSDFNVNDISTAYLAFGWTTGIVGTNNYAVHFSTVKEIRYISDAIGLPTGIATVKFPNIKLPKNSGDEMMVNIAIFENANQFPRFITGSHVWDFTTASNYHTLTGTAPSTPVGNLASNVVYVGSGGITQSKTVTFSSGWTTIISDVVNNSNGTSIYSNYLNPNEHDGTGLTTAYRTLTSGNPSFSLSRTSNPSNPPTKTSSALLFAILPLARPSVTGTVYRDNNGLTDGINGGGTGGSVWTTANSIYVNAINESGNVLASALVNTSGVFSFPTGGNLIEGDVIKFQLSKIQGTVGQPAPIKELPVEWRTVGESITSGTSDGNPNGEFTLTIGTENSPNNTTYRFGITTCAGGTTAPSVQNISNNCPATTVNLNTAHTGTVPAGSSLVWFTNNAHTGTALSGTQITQSGSGIYYAFYYDSANNCFSPTSAPVTVSINNCPGTFGCNNTMYLSQTNTLYTIGTSTNPFTYPTIGTSSVGYNGIGLNPLDGKIYGIQTGSTNLLVINPDGTSTNLGAISNLPTGNLTYFAGEIDAAGNYYIMPNTVGGSNRFYRVNLSTRVATLIPLSRNNAYIPDIAYNITDGLLYGVDNSANGQLVTINPSTGVVTGIGVGPISSNFGAMFTSSTGEVFGVRNDGGFYQFNRTTGERVLISGAAASSANDGAHCVTSPITFSTDLSVTKTDNTTTYASGTTTIYSIVVTNNGPYGVLNAEVKDLVPVGIPTANVSYTAVASSGSTTAVSGVQTGSINDFVGLPVGGTVTYTVVVNIPFGFNGDLINTVTVKAPSNITETNLANNTVTDTDLQTVCYRPMISSGVTLDTKHGITTLGRAGADNGNWPMVRKGAWTALEAKTKGFVVNRIPTTAALTAIANPIEGMIVYDEEADCLKIYSSTDGISFSWKCFITPACPD